MAFSLLAHEAHGLSTSIVSTVCYCAQILLGNQTKAWNTAAQHAYTCPVHNYKLRIIIICNIVSSTQPVSETLGPPRTPIRTAAKFSSNGSLASLVGRRLRGHASKLYVQIHERNER